MEREQIPFHRGMFNFRDGRQPVDRAFSQDQYEAFAPASATHITCWYPDGGWNAAGVFRAPRPLLTFLEAIIWGTTRTQWGSISPYVASCLDRFFNSDECPVRADVLKILLGSLNHPSQPLGPQDKILARLAEYRTTLAKRCRVIPPQERRIYDFSYGTGEFWFSICYSPAAVRQVATLDERHWHGNLWYRTSRTRSYGDAPLEPQAFPRPPIAVRNVVLPLTGTMRNVHFIRALATSDIPWTQVYEMHREDRRTARAVVGSFVELLRFYEAFVLRINTPEGEAVPEQMDVNQLVQGMDDSANMLAQSVGERARSAVTRDRSRELEAGPAYRTRQRQLVDDVTRIFSANDSLVQDALPRMQPDNRYGDGLFAMQGMRLPQEAFDAANISGISSNLPRSRADSMMVLDDDLEFGDILPPQQPQRLAIAPPPARVNPTAPLSIEDRYLPVNIPMRENRQEQIDQQMLVNRVNALVQQGVLDQNRNVIDRGIRQVIDDPQQRERLAGIVVNEVIARQPAPPALEPQYQNIPLPPQYINEELELEIFRRVNPNYVPPQPLVNAPQDVPQQVQHLVPQHVPEAQLAAPIAPAPIIRPIFPEERAERERRQDELNAIDGECVDDIRPHAHVYLPIPRAQTDLIRRYLQWEHDNFLMHLTPPLMRDNPVTGEYMARALMVFHNVARLHRDGSAERVGILRFIPDAVEPRCPLWVYEYRVTLWTAAIYHYYYRYSLINYLSPGDRITFRNIFAATYQPSVEIPKYVPDANMPDYNVAFSVDKCALMIAQIPDVYEAVDMRPFNVRPIQIPRQMLIDEPVPRPAPQRQQPAPQRERPAPQRAPRRPEPAMRPGDMDLEHLLVLDENDNVEPVPIQEMDEADYNNNMARIGEVRDPPAGAMDMEQLRQNVNQMWDDEQMDEPDFNERFGRREFGAHDRRPAGEQPNREPLVAPDRRNAGGGAGRGNRRAADPDRPRQRPPAQRPPAQQQPAQQPPAYPQPANIEGVQVGYGRGANNYRNIVPLRGNEPDVRIPLYGEGFNPPENAIHIFTDVDFINGVARSGQAGMVCVVGQPRNTNDIIEVLYEEFRPIAGFTNRGVYGADWDRMDAAQRDLLLDEWLLQDLDWDRIIERTWKLDFRRPAMINAAVAGNARREVIRGAARGNIRRGALQAMGIEQVVDDGRLWELVDQLDDQAVVELANICWSARTPDPRYFDTMRSRDDLLDYLVNLPVSPAVLLDGVTEFKTMAAARVVTQRSTYIENGRIRRNINETNLSLSKRAPNYYTIKGPPGMGDAPLDYEVPPPAAVKYLSTQFRGIPVSKKIIRENNQFSDLVQGLNDVVDTGLYREKEMLLQYKSSMFYSAWKICKDLLEREEKSMTSSFTVQSVQTFTWTGLAEDQDPADPAAGYALRPKPSRYIDFTEILGHARGGALCVPHKLRVTFSRNPPNSSASWGFYVVNHRNFLPGARDARGVLLGEPPAASYYKIRYGDGFLIPGGLAERHDNNYGGAGVLQAYNYGAVRPLIKFSKAAKRTQEFEIKPWFGYTDSIYSPLFIPLISDRQQLIAPGVYSKTVTNGLPISENFTRMSCSLMGAREFSTWNAQNETTPWDKYYEKANDFLTRLNEYVRDCTNRLACRVGMYADASALILQGRVTFGQTLDIWNEFLNPANTNDAAARAALGGTTFGNFADEVYPGPWRLTNFDWAMIPGTTRPSSLPPGFQTVGATAQQICSVFMSVVPFSQIQGVWAWRYVTWQAPQNGRGAGRDACQWMDMILTPGTAILPALTAMKRHLDNLKNFDTFLRTRRQALRGAHSELLAAFRQCRPVITEVYQQTVPLDALEQVLAYPIVYQDDFWDFGNVRFVPGILNIQQQPPAVQQAIAALNLNLLGIKMGVTSPGRDAAGDAVAAHCFALQEPAQNRAVAHYVDFVRSNANMSSWEAFVAVLTRTVGAVDGNEMGVDAAANRRARIANLVERPLKVSSNNDDPFNLRVVTSAAQMAEYMQERLEFAAEDYKTHVNAQGGMRNLVRLPYHNSTHYMLLLPDNVQEGTPITVTYSTFNDHKTYIKYLFLHQYLKVFNYGSKKEVKKIADRRVDTYLTEDIKGIKKLIETFGGDAKTLDRFTKRS